MGSPSKLTDTNGKEPKKSRRGAHLPNGPGHGRPKGVPNKNTKALKDMILGALDKAGGEDYLYEQAVAQPTAFLSLIGKVLPMAVNLGDADGNKFSVNFTFVKPDGK